MFLKRRGLAGDQSIVGLNPSTTAATFDPELREPMNLGRGRLPLEKTPSTQKTTRLFGENIFSPYDGLPKMLFHLRQFAYYDCLHTASSPMTVCLMIVRLIRGKMLWRRGRFG